MGLDFVRNFGGRRVQQYDPQPPLFNPPSDEEERDEEVELGYEVPPDRWEAIDTKLPPSWRPRAWPGRPVRFIDGKDNGHTVAWLRAPGGYPVPVRLSEIGGVEVRVVDGECRRTFVIQQRVVSMVADRVFPFEEVEGFAADLRAHGFRFLVAKSPNNRPSYDFEEMRKAAQNRSNDEMGVLEEAVLAREDETPTIVDGRLEPRSGGFDTKESPVFGVIKTHSENYLHPIGLQLQYRLEVGQRTPVFKLKKGRLAVVTWFVRLSGGGGSTPNWGLVRVEASARWFETRGKDYGFVDRLSRTLCEYRCRERNYPRAAVSLQPIVRAEQTLGALFSPPSAMASRFYRLTSL